MRRRGHYFLARAAAAAAQPYRVCNDCNKRTPHVCTKCGLCYSCHWKIERMQLINQQQQQLQLAVGAAATTTAAVGTTTTTIT